MKVTPPDVPMPGMAGGEKAKARSPSGNLRRAPVHVLDDGRVFLLGRFALVSIP